MLVLTRRNGESIHVGDDIKVTILDVGRDSVRIGIDAPRQTRIHRAELIAAVRDENAAAVTASGSATAEAAILAALAGAKPAPAQDAPENEYVEVVAVGFDAHAVVWAHPATRSFEWANTKGDSSRANLIRESLGRGDRHEAMAWLLERMGRIFMPADIAAAVSKIADYRFADRVR